MKKRGIGGFIGLVLLMAGCGDSTVTQAPLQPEQAANQVLTSAQPAASAPQPAPATSSLPGVAVSANPPQPLPVPDLIPPTAPNQRASQVAAGRVDPFTAIANAPIVTATARPTTTRPTTARSTTPTVSAAPQPTPSAAVSPQRAAVPTPAPLPSLVPAPADVSQLPNVAVNSAPIAAAPTTLANSIEVSGVVQAGDRTSAIIQTPQDGSRYVSAGDYLANGRILVKRIEVGNAETEPVVILEQDGVEVIRTVGSSEGLL